MAPPAGTTLPPLLYHVGEQKLKGKKKKREK